MHASRRTVLIAGLSAWTAAAPGGTQAAEPTAGFDVQPWPRGQAMPALPLVDQVGVHWKLADLRGRAVLLNFWASWCEPCRAEIPSLQALAEREAQRLAVITINLKESPDAVQRFVQGTGLQLPVVRDVQGDLAKAWGIRIYPSTVLIDPQGRAQSTMRGALDWVGPEGARLLAALQAPQRARKR
ncbi:redoxin domain-containing protein [Rhodoferax saidenbachensis]|uniref:Thiol-disulfide isomerase/thioredoxin n=1 Tax=Rhodoferax saidenbachensis TaxID=1484693 RepID=A0ABU1ZH68_9BURK|nr:redoxin domain-containing protein [Rhodoferax saidenbachensis]MDR7304877.1 thiol-disulfide isomerase/thioredoxin [Rhodoferax saidenbachensis]